jgi:hypothetical protein
MLQRSPATLLSTVAVVILAAAASILLPESLEWNVIRLVLALGCLPWFAQALRNARASSGDAPPNRTSWVKH